MLRRVRVGFLLAAGIASLTSLGSSQQAGPYVAREVADGGLITGTVTLAGDAGPPKELNITKDPEICGKEPKFEEDLVVSRETGGLKNVVVWLSDIKEGKAWEARTQPVTLDQNGCRFAPHVLIVPAGETLDILNSDGLLHNIHTRSSENRPINKAHPKFLKRLQATFKRPEIVRVDCDAHEWMRGWIAVAAHPYYAATDENGKYRLEDIPPGTYTLTLWHETLGDQTRKVNVTAGAEARVDLEYTLR